MFTSFLYADESGWAWFIPLHNGTTSVGVVMNQEVYNQKLKRPTPSSPFSSGSASNHSDSDSTTRYLASLSLAPHLVDLIGNKGMLMEGTIAKASDYSYSAPSYAGNGYRIVGDAGGNPTYSFLAWTHYVNSIHRSPLLKRYPLGHDFCSIRRCYHMRFLSW